MERPSVRGACRLSSAAGKVRFSHAISFLQVSRLDSMFAVPCGKATLRRRSTVASAFIKHVRCSLLTTVRPHADVRIAFCLPSAVHLCCVRPHPQALETAEGKAPPALDTLFDDVYKTMPPHLQEQKGQLQSHLQRNPDQAFKGESH